MSKTDRNNLLAGRIAIVVLLMMAVGTVFVFSAGANVAQGFEWERFYASTALRQILFFPLAVVVMFAAWRLDYRRFSPENGWFRSPLPYFLAVTVVLLVVVLVPQVGTEVNYARRWLRIPLGAATVSFQPSELAKWVLVFFLAAFCHKSADTLKRFWGGFVPVCGVIGLVVGLVIIEDFGSAALIALLSFLILLAAGVNYRHILIPVPFAAAAFAVAIITSAERRMRILAFLHPDKWADSANYQANQSLIALGSGGLFGKGLGMGICKYGHLPEDTSDFIFAIIGEELGFVGTAAVLVLFIAFVWLGVLVVVRCKDRFGQLLAAAIVLTIAVQAVLNIGVVTVVLPTKGLPLPFISAGGTSLLLSAAAVGVLLNIASQCGSRAAEKTHSV